VSTRAVTDRADLRLRAFDRVLRRVGPAVGTMTPEQLRQVRRREIPDNPLAHLVFGRPARNVEVVERRIDDHDWPIPLRTYRPRGATGLPVVVFFHGGGWVIGNVAQSAWMCGQLAQRVDAVVVSAGYRLAPEHRFPAAVEDSYAGLRWISAHAGELGGDASRLAVMGASAGGNLAAVACQRARDEDGPAIVHQTLLYPSVDIAPEAPPPADLDDAPMLPKADRIAYVNHYTFGQADPTDPRLSPLRAASLADLPPALVITAEHDPLRDEGRRYAERLRAEGTPARYTDYVGMAHGFMSFPGLASAARQALAEICQELTGAFHG
jgi:acetyl esterase/lipase